MDLGLSFVLGLVGAVILGVILILVAPQGLGTD